MVPVVPGTWKGNLGQLFGGQMALRYGVAREALHKSWRAVLKGNLGQCGGGLGASMDTAIACVSIVALVDTWVGGRGRQCLALHVGSNPHCCYKTSRVILRKKLGCNWQRVNVTMAMAITHKHECAKNYISSAN